MEVLDRNRPALLFRVLNPVLILALAAGCVYLLFQNNRLIKQNAKLENSISGEPVAVFFVESQKGVFKLKPVLYPVKAGGDKHVQALEVLLAGEPRDIKLTGVFPKGVKLVSFNLKNGLATVNLNKNAANMNMGSSWEALAVASIVNTLTKFPDVYRVKILIEGKEVESLAGHVDLTGELHYTDFPVDPFPDE